MIPCLKKEYVLERSKLQGFQRPLSSRLEGLLNRQERAFGHLSPAEESVQLPESCAQRCKVTAFMNCHLSCGGAFSDAPATFTTSPAVLRHPASARSPLHIPVATPVTTHGLTNVNLPAASLCSVPHSLFWVNREALYLYRTSVLHGDVAGATLQEDERKISWNAVQFSGQCLLIFQRQMLQQSFQIVTKAIAAECILGH